MGSVGDCFDNAMCESFFATLECELLDRHHFKTQIEARMAVFDFIEGWYNPQRRHSALDYLSPCEYEHFCRDQAKQITRSSTASRTAWPPQTTAAGALHGGAVSDSKPITLSGPPSDEMPGGAEKLVSDQCQDRTLGEAKPVN